MKKLVAKIMSAVMTMGMLHSPGFADSNTELNGKLLSDWFDYVYVCENLYGNMLWAADAVDAYLQDPAWEKLQIANMAVSTAEMYIRLRELPAATMTDADYDALIGAGKDVPVVKVARESYPQSREAERNVLINYRMELGYSAFWQYGVSMLKDDVAGVKELMDCQLRYLALTNEYLLATLGDSEQAAKFRAFVQEHCPLTHAAAPKNPLTMAEAETAAEKVLDEIEKLAMERSGVLGQSQAALDMHYDAIASGDISVLSDNAVQIPGLPLMLPDPGWFGGLDVHATYYWLDEEGSITLAKERQMIDRSPDGYAVDCPGVAREEVLNYVAQLSQLGLKPMSPPADEGMTRVYYQIGGYAFAITWEDGGATINMLENQICFAPVWYIQAVQQAD